ncbi:MAG: DUF3990 domain-containing protein [Bacilli bacterium]|nr:DUF3990 domain-containing protein [Bacilli bacterium]
MILYHGSNVEVREPRIITAEKGRDFGFAFYLTPIKAQAERWAKRRQRLAGAAAGIVSVFEWDEKKENLKYKKYANPDMEWLEMIISCRSDIRFHHDFDIVEGKIADDSVGETILFVMDGIIKKEDALERLRFQRINSQIAFCSERALERLTFIRSYEVK